jgi:hypothetical protein
MEQSLLIQGKGHDNSLTQKENKLLISVIKRSFKNG